MAEFYRSFIGDSYNNLDFSDKAKEEMYLFETYGTPKLDVYSIFGNSDKKNNGYLVGKRAIDITVAMWMESFNNNGWVSTLEMLYDDPDLPKWFLDKIFKNPVKQRLRVYREIGIDKEWITRCIKEYELLRSKRKD